MEEFIAILMEFVDAAGKAFGEKMADDLFNFLTKEIATKDSIAKAVAEIERYIAQVIDQLEKDLIESHLNHGIRAMADYENTKNENFLLEANNTVGEGVGLLDVKLGVQPELQRTYFIAILHLLAIDVAIWIALCAKHKNNRGYRKSLSDRVDRTCTILQNGLNMIEDFEHETVGPPNVRMDMTREGEPGDPPMWSYSYQGYVELTRKRYSGGIQEVAGEWHGDNDAPAIDDSHAIYSREAARVIEEAQVREDKIYAPTRKFMNAIRKFQLKSEAFKIDAPIPLMRNATIPRMR
jgi:hypothetical protein